MTYHDARTELLQPKRDIPFKELAIEAIVIVGFVSLLVMFST